MLGRLAPDFFLPVRVLSRVFRGKFLAGLRAAYTGGRLRLTCRCPGGEAAEFERRVSAALRTDWVVYAKPPFGGPEVVLKYLARYTHRVAISDSRLLDFEDGVVRFRYKDYAHGNRKRVMSLSASEFVRRFLLHVLPAGLVRIRHYGILSNRHRHEDLALCRELLGGEAAEPEAAEAVKVPEGPESIGPTRVCPVCGAGRMVVIAEFPRRRRGRRCSWGSRSARRWTARERRGRVGGSAGDDRRGKRAGDSPRRGEKPGSEGSRAGGEGGARGGSGGG